MSELTQAIKNNRDNVQKLNSNPIIRLCWNLALLIVGVALILNPSVGTEVIVMIVGIALIVYGAATLITDAVKHYNSSSSVLMPLIAIAAGILLIIFRGFTANVLLPLVIGIWAVYYGITNLNACTKIRKAGGYWHGQFAMALIMLGLGVAVLAVMASGGNAIGIILGVCLIAYSAPEIVKWIISKAEKK